jgi:hypothetical protein
MTLALRVFEGSYAVPLSWKGDQASSPAPYTSPEVYEVQDDVARTGSDTTRNWVLKVDSEPKRATQPSVTYIYGRRDRVKARLRMLRRLPSNHDNEGAASPNSKSIDTAIAFIDRIKGGPDFSATLDDDGSAVLEFENRQTGLFADITFLPDGRVELYKREPGQQSELYEGALDGPDARRFLETKIGLVV